MTNPISAALIFLALSSLAHAQNEWTKLESNVTVALTDVHFVDAGKGYVVGDSGVVLRTTDRGDSWQRLSLGASDSITTDWHFSKVLFLTPSSGYVFGGKRQRPLEPIVLTTTDGGDSWSRQAINTLGRITDAQVIDGRVIAVGGSWDSPTFEIVASTTNEGETWDMVPSSGTMPILAFDFKSTTEGLGVFMKTGDPGGYSVRKTTDAGHTWQILATPLQDNTPISDIHYLGERRWLIASRNGIFRSEDDGSSWRHINDPYAWRYGFADTQHGYMVSGWYPSASIAETTDGGNTWTARELPVGARTSMLGVSAPTASIAYAVGENGTIVRLERTTSTTRDNPDHPAEKLTVFPSPARRTITIGTTPAHRLRSYVVVDALGTSVQRGAIEPGVSTLEVPVDVLDSGMYWVIVGQKSAALLVAH